MREKSGERKNLIKKCFEWDLKKTKHNVLQRKKRMKNSLMENKYEVK